MQALHPIVISLVGPNLPETTLKQLSQNKVPLKIEFCYRTIIHYATGMYGHMQFLFGFQWVKVFCTL